MMSVVVMMCHMLALIPVPVCHEEIVVKQPMSIEACIMSQPALANWKAQSIYAGEQWSIGGYKCVPGDYVVKDAI